MFYMTSCVDLPHYSDLFYLLQPTTWSRLAILSYGNAAAVLYLCAKLFSGSERQRTGQMWLLMSTNYLFLASRVVTVSIAPAWMNHRANLMVASVIAASTVGEITLTLSLRKSTGKITSRNGDVADFFTENAKG